MVFSGSNVGLDVAAEDKASVIQKYIGKRGVKKYLEAERRAIECRSGVWHDPNGITRAWAFRRNYKSNLVEWIVLATSDSLIAT